MSTLSSTFGSPALSSDIRQKPEKLTSQRPFSRLYWTLNGPIDSAISVMPENSNTVSSSARWPYYISETVGWHPISECTLFARTLSVSIENMAWAAEAWSKRHEQHLVDLAKKGERPELSTPRASDGWRSRVCCEEPEPHSLAPLEVVASSPIDGITIHDYVSAVHPWLMSRRADILAAMHTADKYFDADAEALLLVNVRDPESLLVQSYEDWQADRSSMGSAPSAHNPLQDFSAVDIKPASAKDRNRRKFA